MQVHDILIKPWMTETTMNAIAKSNRYTFVVHPQATKVQIRKAIEALFGVHVTNVRTIVVKGGTTKRVGARISYTTRQNWKKAIVQLKTGDAIDLFETGEEADKKGKKVKKK